MASRHTRKKSHVINGTRKDEAGWIHISVYGTPQERGYAYGYLVFNEIKNVKEMLEFSVYEDTGRPWSYFVEASTNNLKPVIQTAFPEFFDEMKAFADGCTAAGTPFTLDEVIAWNNYFLLLDYWYPTQDGNKSSGRGEGGASDHCSAFIATGDYTKDGKIVTAHNNFSNFLDGQFANVVLDIKPEKGHKMLIQGFVGWIWSGTDFFVTSAGIVGSETTVGGFHGYEPNFPVSCRIRQAMQYGNTLDDYVTILLEGNSGDYANSWLFGDTKTNEIMMFELGLQFHNVQRTKNGYFIGFNATYDPRIRNLECSNSGFNDVRRHQGARKVRLGDLMAQYKGQIDLEVAKTIISDHYDVYLKKDAGGNSRTVCSHYDEDAREYMSEADRPLPFQARGAVDGNIADSNMIKNMSFELIWGRSCGQAFNKDKFCDEHRQWQHLCPFLVSRPSQPWVVFRSEKRGGKRKLRRQTKKIVLS